jgi:hypothetical protein
MTQINQGKISVQQGEKQGEDIQWGTVVGEREFLYYGETTEAIESMSWEDAEEISHQPLQASYAVLLKSWSRDENNGWKQESERILLWFPKEEALRTPDISKR